MKEAIPSLPGSHASPDPGDLRPRDAAGRPERRHEAAGNIPGKRHRGTAVITFRTGVASLSPGSYLATAQSRHAP